MKLNDKQKLVLIAVLSDQWELAARDYHAGDNLPAMQKGRFRLAIKNARAGLVPLALSSWLDHVPTASETVMFGREYERLERMGLLERVNLAGGRRTTHLRLTDEGSRIAEGLLAEEPAVDTDEPLNMADFDLSSLVLPEELIAETDAPTAP